MVPSPVRSLRRAGALGRGGESSLGGVRGEWIRNTDSPWPSPCTWQTWPIDHSSQALLLSLSQASQSFTTQTCPLALEVWGQLWISPSVFSWGTS